MDPRELLGGQQKAANCADARYSYFYEVDILYGMAFGCGRDVDL